MGDVETVVLLYLREKVLYFWKETKKKFLAHMIWCGDNNIVIFPLKTSKYRLMSQNQLYPYIDKNALRREIWREKSI